MLDRMNIRSCSTLVAVGSGTKTKSVIFGKNSDRAINEPQPLCYFPAKDYAEGTMVKCTFASIPQEKHTYGCIGSRPGNIFGFEHGVNEWGVIIGNEAVAGRELPETTPGLIGMDLLRLALERADSAAKAVEVIGHLLETYGTGGDPEVRVQYFNANFIIADGKEAYLFESCQRYWAAKKVNTTGHLSNCYSIGSDYDLIGAKTLQGVIEKGWAPSNEKINMAAAFTNSDGDYSWAEGYFRYYRQHQLLNEQNPVSVKGMMNMLRDHYTSEMTGVLPYSIAAAKMPTICCHAGGMEGCITAASVVCELNDHGPDPFKFIYWGSMAPPCCSVFRPYFNIGWLPEDVQYAGTTYDQRSQWWTFVELERYIALNYGEFSPKVREGFGILEDQFIEQVNLLRKSYDGNINELKKFSAYANEESLRLAQSYLKEIKQKISDRDLDFLLIDYFKKSAKACGMETDVKF